MIDASVYIKQTGSVDSVFTAYLTSAGSSALSHTIAINHLTCRNDGYKKLEVGTGSLLLLLEGLKSNCSPSAGVPNGPRHPSLSADVTSRRPGSHADGSRPGGHH